jgi:hypothetical protein
MSAQLHPATPSMQDSTITTGQESVRASRLYLSFWDVCIDNLPIGRFERRKLAAAEACLLIRAARENHALCCVSNDDLLAPYLQKQRRNHDALRAVLQNRFDIALRFDDFLSGYGDEDSAIQSVMPLQLARLQPGDRMLIVTCCYTLSPETKTADAMDRFEVAEDSVGFDLIEALAP